MLVIQLHEYKRGSLFTFIHARATVNISFYALVRDVKFRFINYDTNLSSWKLLYSRLSAIKEEKFLKLRY